MAASRHICRRTETIFRAEYDGLGGDAMRKSLLTDGWEDEWTPDGPLSDKLYLSAELMK